jgi:hypothetical protein
LCTSSFWSSVFLAGRSSRPAYSSSLVLLTWDLACGDTGSIVYGLNLLVVIVATPGIEVLGLRALKSLPSSRSAEPGSEANRSFGFVFSATLCRWRVSALKPVTTDPPLSSAPSLSFLKSDSDFI